LKKLIAIGFLAVLLLSSTEAYQLLKIPYIFKHFASHHRESPGLSFVAFLDMHYMHGSPRDNDYQDDMKLPFKTADNSTVNLSPFFSPISSIASEIKPVELPKLATCTFSEDFIPSAHLSRIWQPPKSC